MFNYENLIIRWDVTVKYCTTSCKSILSVLCTYYTVCKCSVSQHPMPVSQYVSSGISLEVNAFGQEMLSGQDNSKAIVDRNAKLDNSQIGHYEITTRLIHWGSLPKPMPFNGETLGQCALGLTHCWAWVLGTSHRAYHWEITVFPTWPLFNDNQADTSRLVSRTLVLPWENHLPLCALGLLCRRAWVLGTIPEG